MATFTVQFSSGRVETFEDATMEIGPSNGVLTITKADGSVRIHSPEHWRRINTDA